MNEIAVLAKATLKSKFLRTTVPTGIVKLFNLSRGDRCNWGIIAEEGKLVIIVKPLRSENDDKKDTNE